MMQQKNYLVLAQYREGSSYADQPGTRYHFPRKYFNFMTLSDIEFIYYEPKKLGQGEYFGYGQVGEVTADPDNPEHYFAEILNFRRFQPPVSGTRDGKSRESGPFYNAQNAVRRIDPEVFADICGKGGIDLDSLGVEPESADSDEAITDPFDPAQIKVDREPMSVFQVLRKISLGEIVLYPEFQRNLVWDPVRRSRLIESALLRIPLPAFYFDGVDANRWVVIDGLQRLSTLRDFMTSRSFRLQGLEYLGRPADGKTFDELPRGMQRDLEETQVTLFIIRPQTPPEVKFTIFYRINTGGLELTPQEIRHALFQGSATRLLQTLAGSKEFLTATEEGVSDTRMDARECVLRYLAFRMHPYREYSKADLNSFLSNTMSDLNRSSPARLKQLAQDFTESMDRAREILGRFAFRRFDPTSRRRGPVNKALFETWSNVLQEYDLEVLRRNRDKIQASLGKMLLEDADYVRALSAGTGGVTSVHVRFERTHAAIEAAIQ
jgi:hypothetical protein